MNKSVLIIMFFLSARFLYGQENLVNFDNQINATLKGYLSSKTWLERSKYVVKRENTLELMESRYEDLDFEKDLIDTTSYLYQLRENVVTNTDPWLKVKGFENYYRKKLNTKYGFNKENSQFVQYIVLKKDNNFLIDWEATLGISELSIKALDAKNSSDYVAMRVYMIINDLFFDQAHIPDYFPVSIHQEGDERSETALIYKDSESGKKLYEKLLDGKWHTKVIWVKKFNFLSKKPDILKKTVDNIRLIGFVNSIENDSWIIDENSKTNRISLEDKNLANEKIKYDNFLKYENLVANPPLKLKILDAAKTEYYDKQITLYGRLKIDSYYNCGYLNTESSYYSFKLSDNEWKTIQIYFKKTECTELVNQLKEKDEITVKVIAIPISSKQNENWCSIMLEGVSFEILK